MEDIYMSIKQLTSYKGLITDIVLRPNIMLNPYNTYNIKELALIKESETPSVISENSKTELM
jgi:hypothetical protein